MSDRDDLIEQIARIHDVPVDMLTPPPCIGNDPACPCADGLACHYKDYPAEGHYPAVKGWPIPEDDDTTIVRGRD